MVALNVASIGLGLLAWALAIGTVGWKKQKRLLLCPFASITCCAGSLLLQHYATSWLIVNDLSAAIDTADGYPLARVAAFLLVTTLLLNAGAFLLGYIFKKGT